MFKRVITTIMLIILMISSVTTVCAIEKVENTDSTEHSEVSEELTFIEWVKIKDIEGELETIKNTVVIRFINTSFIVIGTMMLVMGILLIFTYWFDVLNNFTSISILSFISLGKIYPVINKDILPYTEKSMKLVTFKDVMLRAAILWIVGVMLYESNKIIELIVRTYLYLSGI